jgi:hypothetical protein
MESDLESRRTRLAAVEAELTKLRYRHDVAFSAFRFEEATALGPSIAALERERAELAASLPPEPPSPPALTRVEVPRGRRGRRSR